ncbi:hypothetical protein DFH27DRAFT_639979 [Peziza echinospora]|nr:hypothetical protein DFH27DRAFT_639979 [Peziza echinospora]
MSQSDGAAHASGDRRCSRHILHDTAGRGDWPMPARNRSTRHQIARWVPSAKDGRWTCGQDRGSRLDDVPTPSSSPLSDRRCWDVQPSSCKGTHVSQAQKLRSAPLEAQGKQPAPFHAPWLGVPTVAVNKCSARKQWGVGRGAEGAEGVAVGGASWWRVVGLGGLAPPLPGPPALSAWARASQRGSSQLQGPRAKIPWRGTKSVTAPPARRGQQAPPAAEAAKHYHRTQEDHTDQLPVEG